MSGVGLIGSCVTRDVWRLLDIPTNALRTFSRTSLASLTSPPPEGFAMPESMGVLEPGGFLARCVRADVEKTALAELEADPPDVLVFDFIDERFDLVRTRDSIVCDSFEFRRSGLRAVSPLIDGRLIRRLSPEAHAAWLVGLERLRDRITAGPLSGARIVLHIAYWAESYWEDGELRPFPERTRFHPVPRVPELVADHNALLERCHDAFLSTFPQAIVIAPADEFRIGDAAHAWGLSPHHYVDGYYRAFRDLCQARGVIL